MITTTAHSTKRTTNPTPTLRHQPTAIRLSTSTTPPLHTSYNTSPLPINPNPPSSTTAKSKTTPSDTQSKYLPLTFHFIPNRPNYISKLKLSMNLAKPCNDIQRNAELSIIKIVEEHLTKQNKRKNSKKSKKVRIFKPRFQPTEHPPTSSIHIVPKTDTTTTTQNMRLGFKTYMSTTPTRYIQPKHCHAIHPSNLQSRSHAVCSTNLPKPLFHLHQVPTSSTKHYCRALPTKHPPYIETHIQTCTIR